MERELSGCRNTSSRGLWRSQKKKKKKKKKKIH